MKLGLLILLSMTAPAADFIFTAATINGSGPFRLLVDTGASSTSLDPVAAKAAGLEPSLAVRLTTLSGETLVPAAAARSVRVGQTEIHDVEVLIMAPTAVRTVDRKVDGILGQSFLSRIPWMMDYGNRRFVTGETAALLSRLLPEFTCERTIDSRLVVPITIGKASFRVAIDSGASHLVLHCGTGCPKLDQVDPSRRILTSTGTARATLGKVRAIAAGPLSLKQRDAVLIESPPLEPSIHGVLPAAWFKAIFADPQSAAVRLAK